VWRPPFLLEKHVRISVYQLYIPTPVHLVLPAPPEAMPRGLLSGGGDCPRGLALALPLGWRPGVAFAGGEGPGAGGLSVSYELPDIPPAALARCASEAPALARLPLALRDPRRLVRRSPRARFCLRLAAGHPLEAPAAGLSLAPDHIALRLPLFYGGSALPDRPASIVAPRELAALRERAREGLACRACGARLLRGAGAGPLRALLLPSEHWLEMSDFWLCHAEERSRLLPEEDFGAAAGAALAGETQLQMHPADARPGALSLRLVHSPGARAPQAPAQARPRLCGPPASALHHLCCSRCGRELGSTRAPAPGCPEAARWAPLPPPPPGGWPPRLSLEHDSVLRLHKDALHLAPEAEEEDEAGGAAEGAGGGAAEGAAWARGEASARAVLPLSRRLSGGVFSSHTACTRLAHVLFTAAHSGQQFRFAITVTTHGGEEEEEEEGGQGEGEGEEPGAGEAAPAPTFTALSLVLLNWNTSIRGAAAPLALPDSSASTAAGATTGEYFDRDADVPVLKLRFALGEPPQEARGGDAVAQQEVHMHARDVRAVAEMLTYSNGLLPLSARMLEGWAIGYLPFQ